MVYGFLLTVLLNFSIIIPAITGITRFKQGRSHFYPLIILVWAGFINECLSFILIYTIRSNTINSNIYVLLEYELILFQFFKWNNGLLKKIYFFACAGLIVWTADNLVINSLNTDNSIFRIFYSFIVVLFSIDEINKIIIYERRRLLQNPMFLVCISFLLYYGCKAFVEVFNAFQLELSDAFNLDVFLILNFANCVSNIIYAIAILCIPTKQEFSLPY